MDNCPNCQNEMELMKVEDNAPEMAGKMVYVCHNCKSLFQECEVWSRVVGYLRPTKAWNKGKKEEFEQRKDYKIS